MRHPALLTLLLLILGGLSWWLSQEPEPEEAPSYVQGPREIDYYLRDLHLTRMDPQGQPAHILISPLVKHFPDDDTTELATPNLTVFQGERPPWVIDSEQGWVSADGELILLNGPVHIERAGTALQKPVIIDTHNLRVQPKQDYAETDEVVKVRSEADWLDAKGMRAWLREPSRIKFLADVKGFYAPIE